LVEVVAVSRRIAWRTGPDQLLIELDEKVPALVVEVWIGKDGVDHDRWPRVGNGSVDRRTEAEESGQRATWNPEGLFGREDVLVARRCRSLLPLRDGALLNADCLGESALTHAPAAAGGGERLSEGCVTWQPWPLAASATIWCKWRGYRKARTQLWR
jgi:hypothetical protein